jgi:hypothetical protein
MTAQCTADIPDVGTRHINNIALSYAQLVSIARWIDAMIKHPDATAEQLDAVYNYVSQAPLTEIAETAQSLGY